MPAEPLKISSSEIDDLKDSSEEAARVLKSLANPHRLMILCLLSQGEHSVGQLNEHVSLDQSPLSQHLARLRKEGIVATRKSSQTVYYRISDTNIQQILKTLHSIYCPRP
jgi:DNA-binding transcriptional ArsR family regulator